MTPVEARMVAIGAERLGVELEPAGVDRLDRFLAVLELWNRRARLTGERDRKVLIERHLIDSLAVVPHLPETGTVVDIGSGGGFPGIVLACVRPDLQVVLLESRRRPTSFLREAIRTIPLPAARAIESRAEDAAMDDELSARASVVIARAVRLDAFLAVAAPLLAPGGEAIAMQTPRTADLAPSAGAARGLHLAGRHDYRLAEGRARTLLIFQRTENPSGSVS
jgi:16S rRNA (guanine527-N7)-methyltransferase